MIKIFQLGTLSVYADAPRDLYDIAGLGVALRGGDLGYECGDLRHNQFRVVTFYVGRRKLQLTLRWKQPEEN